MAQDVRCPPMVKSLVSQFRLIYVKGQDNSPPTLLLSHKVFFSPFLCIKKNTKFPFKFFFKSSVCACAVCMKMSEDNLRSQSLSEIGPFALFYCTGQASWPQDSEEYPVSTAYLNIQVLGLQTCSAVPIFWGSTHRSLCLLTKYFTH